MRLEAGQTGMKLNDHILLWNHVFIKIIDVRHTILAPGELPAYRLPSSAFLYVVRGAADVYLDHSRHRVERFHVLHGGRAPGCGPFLKADLNITSCCTGLRRAPRILRKLPG